MTEQTHHYLSTGCLHGEHDYCKSMVGQAGTKRPAQCKFCAAQCEICTINPRRAAIIMGAAC